MGINIIVNRSSQNLSQFVYREIGNRLDQGRENMFLIVPEQYTLGAEDALIKANHLNGLLGVEVLSPKRLGDRVLRDTGGSIKTYMDCHGKNMLLQKTLAEIQNELTIYKNSVKKPGFLQSLSDFISELKQNEITLETLMTTRDSINQGIINQKLNDIIIIYHHFNELLGENRLDDDDRHELVCQKIYKTKFLKSSKIWLDGFQNFSKQDYKMLEALINTVSEFNIAIPWDSKQESCDQEVFQLTKNTIKVIKHIGAQAMVDFKVIECPENEYKNNELNHLDNNLFGYPLHEYKGEIESIGLTQCQNIWEEVEKGAQRIQGLIREKKGDYRDIVVLSGDMENYGSTIKRVFTQYRIPYFMDDLKEIGDNHLVEGIITALETIQNNYRFDDIFGYIKTGFSPISVFDSQDLENYGLEFGIRGKKWEEPFTKVSQNTTINLEEMNQLREKVMGPLLHLKEKTKAKQTYIDFSKAVYEFLEETKIPEKIDQLVEKLFDQGNYEMMGNYNQIWNIIMDILDQITETMGEDQVTREDYLRILKSGFQGYQLGIIPPHQNYVNITDLRRSRSGSFKILMVFGLNEGIIPGIGTEPNLISDMERQMLGSYDVNFQNNREFQMDQERYLVYDVLTKPTSNLYCYWSLSDMEGNTRQPSILLSQILGIFPDIKIASTLQDDPKNIWDKINTPESTFWHLTDYLRDQKSDNHSNDNNEAEIWEIVKEWFKKSETYHDYYETLEKTLNFTGISQEMTPNEASKIYGKSMRTSISRLEQFRQCPFSHYVKYGLKPEGRPMYTIQAPEIGIILHQLIDGFFKKVKKEHLNIRDITKEKRDRMIESVMNQSLPQIKTNVFNSTGQYQYLGKKLERVGKKSIDIIAKHICSGEFEPAYSELSFEEEIQMPEITLGDIKIFGKIDRLDLYEKDGKTYIKIIDYKSGNKKVSYDDIYYGLSLQLLVYLDGAISMIKGDEILPGGTFYFHVDDPIPRVDCVENIESAINKSFKMNGLLLDDPIVIEAMDLEKTKNNSDIIPIHSSSASKLSLDEFNEIIHYVKKTVIYEIQKIYQGEIGIRPYKKGKEYGCKYCEYKAICQFDYEIQESGFDVLKTSMKKEAFFELIKEGDTHEMDQ
jgi:ATP-dependent helicase/nuclease subunit B